MPVLLDTERVPLEQRVDAIRQQLGAASKATRIEPSPEVGARLTQRAADAGTRLLQLQVRSGSLTVNRFVPRPSDPDAEYFSVGSSDGGFVTSTNHDITVTTHGVLRPVDVTSSYEMRYRGPSRISAIMVDFTRLGLSVDVLRSALPRFGHGPLAPLLARHVVELASVADSLEADPFARAANAAVELMRAEVLCAAPERSRQRRGLAESLPTRIEAFVMANLADPDLTPAVVAEAHHVSLRYLYVLLGDRAETPAEWIIRLRLERARSDLLVGSDSVSTVAHRWGFKDHSHFSRRFRATYGMSPTEYAAARQDDS